MDDLLQMAAKLFMEHFSDGKNLDMQQVAQAFQKLLPTEQGQLNMGALVSQFSQDGLDSMVQSFLGDGQNMNMTAAQVMGMLGGDNVNSFASQLNIEPNAAAETLSNVIPELIDKNSKGGALGGIATQLMGNLFR